MIFDLAAANRDGLTRKERMRAIQAAMDTGSYRSMIQEILDEIDQDAGTRTGPSTGSARECSRLL